MSMRDPRTLQAVPPRNVPACKRMTRAASSLFRRLESFRGLGARAEEELLHLTFKKLSRLRLNWSQAVLVDQHCLMLQPARPSLLRDILEDAFAQLAGIRH